MKKLVFFLFLVPVLCHAQLYTVKELKNIALTSSLTMVSGMFDGTAETLKFHTPNFFKRCPGANPQFWNPGLSWVNKWKNGDPDQGERFWQSSRAFVCTTDGYHLMRTGRNLFAMGAIVVHLGEKREWYKYLIDFAVNYLAFSVGFTITYDLIFKD
jgi:hypothetical protein